MEMPGIVKAFYDADSRNDGDALSQTFAVNSIVEDDGARHEGVAAIRKWWETAKQKTPYVAEPIDTTGDSDQIFVRAKVSGEFPGSPAILGFSFTIKDERIVRLEIR